MYIPPPSLLRPLYVIQNLDNPLRDRHRREIGQIIDARDGLEIYGTVEPDEGIGESERSQCNANIKMLIKTTFYF